MLTDEPAGKPATLTSNSAFAETMLKADGEIEPRHIDHAFVVEVGALPIHRALHRLDIDPVVVGAEVSEFILMLGAVSVATLAGA